MYDNFLRYVNVIKYVIYTRLSKEEQGKSFDDQSRSIKNQIKVCQNYIEEEKKNYPNCQFIEIAILKDDGVSGTTFNREDFNKLVKLIEQKKANMVITKDLSRLGRDHIQTDDYIEKWFPEHNVRYVSIMENIDTYGDLVSNEIAPIINWSNEYFARQTSKKIKKTFKEYRKEGKWTGGEIPLGYKKDPHNKYHFIIDEKGKEIVERIFNLALSNMSLDKIVKILIKEKVPLPSVIKNNKRNLSINLWSTRTIKSILQNEIYLGHMIQGKTTRLNHKSNKVIYLPKENWNIVKNTHEPIIDEETFNNVQLLFKTNKNKTINSYNYLLRGLIKCQECHHSISIQRYPKRKTCYTICNYYRKYGSQKKVCTAHRFNYQDLENLVLTSIKEECFKYIDKNKLKEILKNDYQNKHITNNINNNIKKSKQAIMKLKKQIKDIYNDKLEGIITKEQYLNITKEKYEILEYEKKKLSRYINNLKEINKENKEDYDQIIDNFLSLNNKMLLLNLIEIIYLNENGNIDIYYKISKPYNSATFYA